MKKTNIPTTENKAPISKERYAKLVKKYPGVLGKPGDNDMVPVKVWQPGIEHM